MRLFYYIFFLSIFFYRYKYTGQNGEERRIKGERGRRVKAKQFHFNKRSSLALADCKSNSRISTLQVMSQFTALPMASVTSRVPKSGKTPKQFTRVGT